MFTFQPDGPRFAVVCSTTADSPVAVEQLPARGHRFSPPTAIGSPHADLS